MKFYITKYALTKGIFEVDANYFGKRKSIIVNDKFVSFYHNKDFYEKKEDAIKRANDLRIDKIQSLIKMINKLENMKFE